MKRWREKHKDRIAEYQRTRYASNPKKFRELQRQRYYGISPAEAEAMLAGQNSRCAICSTDTPDGRGHWHLDHDHATGKVRGFLCKGCNNGLGFFRDDPLRLELAAAYLRRHEKGRDTLSPVGTQADKA